MCYLNCSITNLSLHLRDSVMLLSYRPNAESHFKFFGAPLFFNFNEFDNSSLLSQINEGVNEFNQRELTLLNPDFKMYKIINNKRESIHNGRAFSINGASVQTVFVSRTIYDSMIEFGEDQILNNHDSSFHEQIINSYQATIERNMVYFQMFSMLKKGSDEIGQEIKEYFKEFGNIHLIDCNKLTEVKDSDCTEEEKLFKSLDIIREQNVDLLNNVEFGNLKLNALYKIKSLSSKDILDLYKGIVAFNSAFYQTGYTIKNEYFYTQGRGASFQLELHKKIVTALEKESLKDEE